MPVQINTCRFCGGWESDPARLVKYGTRHYAHHACYLDSGKTLEALRPAQVGNFPWRVLNDRGLMDRAELICSRGSAA